MPAAELELLLTFLQTSHSTPDLVGWTAAGLADWLAEQGLFPAGTVASEADVTRGRHLRAALNAVVAAGDDSPPDPRTAPAIHAVTSRAPMVLELGDDGALALEPDGAPIDRALAKLVAVL